MREIYLFTFSLAAHKQVKPLFDERTAEEHAPAFSASAAPAFEGQVGTIVGPRERTALR